ncbi:MAG: hypothetical protein LQ337_008403 [Flavoplaca oasis]|nr:MAG: hypothetical protein LQ337_008403 [Flavoplaca oasis]
MLSKLPAEIVQLIVNHLSPSDLPLVRLSSRDLNQHSLRRFSTECLATVRTDLTPKSLHELEAISDLPYLAPNVRCLQFRHVDGWFGDGFVWDRFPSGKLRPGQAGANMLKDLLATKLINCRSFRFDCPYDRMSGGVDASTAPDASSHLTSSDAVSLLFSIIVEANISVESLVMASWNHVRRCCPGSGDMVTPKLPDDLYFQAKFSMLCSNLSELAFEYDTEDHHHDWMLYIIARSPNLKALSLGSGRISRKFLGRFLQDNMATDLVHLRLKFVTLDTHLLSDLLCCRQATLRSLHLKYVSINHYQTWRTILGSIAASSQQLTRLSIFGLTGPLTLRDKCVTVFPSLADLDLAAGSTCTQSASKTRHEYRLLKQSEHRIKLKYTSVCEEPVGVSYSGSAMQETLDALVEAATDVTTPDFWP